MYIRKYQNLMFEETKEVVHGTVKMKHSVSIKYDITW